MKRAEAEVTHGTDRGAPERPRWHHRGSPWITLLVLLAAVLLLRELFESHTETADEGSVLRSQSPGNAAGAGGDDATRSVAAKSLPPARGDAAGPSAELVGGMVLDPMGMPVVGARVRLGEHEASTDREGIFRLPRAHKPLEVHHPLFFARLIPPPHSPLNVREGRDGLAVSEACRHTAPILLVPGLRVWGYVRDEDGASLAGATVTLTQAGRKIRTLTSIDGRYESPLLRVEPASIFVQQDQLRPASLECRRLAPRRSWRHDFVLERGSNLTVEARDAGGHPVPGAQVWAQVRDPTLGPSRAGPWEFLGWTDELGILSSSRLPGSEARVRVAAVGSVLRERPLVGERVRVVLPPAPTLSGQAVDDISGLPVRVKEAVLEHSAHLGEPFAAVPHGGLSTRGTSVGSFMLPLPPAHGVHRLQLRGEGGLEATTDPFTVEPGTKSHRVKLRLKYSNAVHGVVVAEGTPVADETVELRRVDRSGPAVDTVLKTRTSTAGVFRFLQPEPGQYRLHVLRAYRAEVASTPFVLPAAPPYGSITLELLPASSLSGRAEQEDSGSASHVPLFLERQGVKALALERRGWTDADGTFRFDSLPAGVYTLSLDEAHLRDVPYAQTRRQVTISQGEEVFYLLRLETAQP